MPIYRLVVKGRVQTVGYRAHVKQVALAFGIKGQVKNLENGDVEVFAECEREILDQFIEEISIKKDLKNIKTPYVENVEKFGMTDDGYIEPPGAFQTFEVDRGIDDVRLIEKETIECLEIGINYIQSMHEDMNIRFDTMDAKYGVINDNLSKSTEALVALLKRFEDKID
jgi:acylphosphatase